MSKIKTLHKDLVIIGGGPAGLAAAIEAAECGIDNLLIVERDRELGGILTQCIHAGFGLHYFGEELTGPEYAERFISLVNERNIPYITDSMVLELSPGDNMTRDKLLTVISATEGYMRVQAKAVILAMGCRERTRGALNIPGTRPAGIMTAGAAQRFVNIEGYMPGKEVVILGSGDIGLIMARRLTLEGAKVKMVCELMPYSSGLQRNIVQCLDDFDIPLKLSRTVIGINGRERLESVVTAAVDEKLKPIAGTEETVPCDTLLLSVGLIPENELTSGAAIQMDRVTSGAVVNESMMTSADGIFACGNVLHVHDLVDFVTEESKKAGRSAAAYIKNDGTSDPDRRYVVAKAGNGVRYIMPHKMDAEKVSAGDKLFFRVGNIYRNKKVTVKIDGDIIISKKKPKLAPGEMETVELTGKMIEKLKSASELTVEVE